MQGISQVHHTEAALEAIMHIPKIVTYMAVEKGKGHKREKNSTTMMHAL